MQTKYLKIGQQEIEFQLPDDFVKSYYCQESLFRVVFDFDAHKKQSNFRIKCFSDYVRQKKDTTQNGYCPVITFKDKDSASNFRFKIMEHLI